MADIEQLLEKLLRIFPAYFDDLLRLIAGPKRFIAEPAIDQQAGALYSLYSCFPLLACWASLASCCGTYPFKDRAAEAGPREAAAAFRR